MNNGFHAIQASGYCKHCEPFPEACPECWRERAEADEADADRLAERVRSVRLMFETAGMHRTAEDMDDVLEQHDALVSKRAAT